MADEKVDETPKPVVIKGVTLRVVREFRSPVTEVFFTNANNPLLNFAAHWDEEIDLESGRYDLTLTPAEEEAPAPPVEAVHADTGTKIVGTSGMHAEAAPGVDNAAPPEAPAAETEHPAETSDHAAE